MPVPPMPKAGYWQDASATDAQGRILARCQCHRCPRQDTGKMPVLPTAKAGYWQDASSTDSRLLSPYLPISLSPYLPISLLPPPEWQSRWGNI
ncbi:hypothetical protein BJP36_37470 [Moorena producens JHB]|uniref:Uncharacterized protein n=1 Tax=Moorena producens (strain JHB) TaxID=1454205 RepID=A0A9Q9UWD5_MOOP1|nr:hypothetical protein [Moorena producens]WAN69786.1 hypothetical protein BJP36_37470 [Moorena producens JHB]